MKRFWLGLIGTLKVFGCISFVLLGLNAQAAEYHERIPLSNTRDSEKSLEDLRQIALRNPTQENVKAFLLTYKQEIEREKKFEAAKAGVLSQNPELQVFYENYEIEVRKQNAHKRFIEEQYLSAFYDSTLSCQKPKEE